MNQGNVRSNSGSNWELSLSVALLVFLLCGLLSLLPLSVKLDSSSSVHSLGEECDEELIAEESRLGLSSMGLAARDSERDSK